MNATGDELKLVALDRDDIEVVSAHLQDALVKVADIRWRPDQNRFVMALDRFDWMSAADVESGGRADYRRCRAVLRFERVLACKCRNLDQADKNARLNLLAVAFEEHNAPAGTVTLAFSGGGTLRLDVECLEAELSDLGEVFVAEICPDHFAHGAATA
jgi:hypothetical protein